MNAIKFIIALAAACIVPALAGGGVPAQSCDRPCLIGIAHSYLNALAAHAPEKLSKSLGVAFTENNVALTLGDALWRTVGAVDSNATIFADPAVQAVGLIVAVREGGRPALLAARLELAHGRVDALDTTVARQNAASFLDANAQRGAVVLNAPVLPAARRPRTALTAIADSYFRRLIDPGAPMPPFDARCNRIENGVQSTNNPHPPPSSPLNPALSRLGCLAQFQTGALTFISKIRSVRYRLVDQEKGLVLASAIFDHDGVPHGTASGNVSRLSANLPSPMSFVVAELFKIDDGRIREIEAVISAVPYGMAAVQR